MESFIEINGKRIETLVAITMEEQQTGLMGKKWPPPAMIFPYKTATIRKFWMKNTPAPLDLIFCNDNKIISICYGEPNSENLIGPNIDSDLVIELPYNTCNMYNFKIGDTVRVNLADKHKEKFGMMYPRWM